MSFKDIKGQDRALSFLKGALAGNRIAHAYIFAGPEGVGKKLAALNFAKAVNCLAPSTPAQELPCDRCLSCRKIDGLNHPDVFLLKAQNDASSIKIDQIRQLIKDASLKAYEARKKVYIIDGAHLMTQEAENALLKTLEEPPTESILILIADRPETLMPTIVSRAQMVRFFPLGLEWIKRILIEGFGMDAGRAHIVSHLSGGMLGQALKYKDARLFEKRSRIIEGLIGKRLFDASDFDGLSKTELKVYLDIMLSWYRDVLIAKTGARTALVNIDSEDAISREARRLDFDTLDNMIKQIIFTGSYLDDNANPKLAMGALELSIGQI